MGEHGSQQPDDLAAVGYIRRAQPVVVISVGVAQKVAINGIAVPEAKQVHFWCFGFGL